MTISCQLELETQADWAPGWTSIYLNFVLLERRFDTENTDTKIDDKANKTLLLSFNYDIIICITNIVKRCKN